MDILFDVLREIPPSILVGVALVLVLVLAADSSRSLD